MYPNQPGQSPYTPQPPSSIDYLNQIASPNSSSGGFSRKKLAIIGGLVVMVFIGLAIMILSNAGPNPTRMGQQLAARLNATTPIVAEAQENIQSGQLATLNSTLRIYLTNTGTKLAEPLGRIGVNSEKLPGNIVTEESQEELAAKLEDARLSGTFDRVYIREMTYQLERIVLLMNQIHTNTRSNSVKEALSTSYESLKPIQEQFAELNAASS